MPFLSLAACLAISALSATQVSTWSPSYSSVIGSTSLPRTAAWMAVGYDERTRNVTLIGGKDYPKQVIRFSIDDQSFTDLGTKFLDVGYRSRPTGYTQVGNTVWMIDQAGTHFLRYNLGTDTMTSTQIAFPFPTAANSVAGNLACLASYDHYVFVVGGAGSSASKVQIYDTRRGEWDTSLLQLSTGRINAGCLVSDRGELFVFAGNSIEVFDVTGLAYASAPRNRTVLTGALGQVQSAPRAVQGDDTIYLLAGMGSAPIKSVTTVSTRSSHWVTANVGSLAGAYAYAAVVLVEDKIHIFGGWSSSWGWSTYQYISLGPVFRSGQQDTGADGGDAGLIVVVVIASVALLVLGVSLFWCFRMNRKQSMLKEKLNQDLEADAN